MKLAKHKGEGEIFCSLQGEGISTGKPAVFARLALCNLYCGWCDSAYTWNFIGTNWNHDSKRKYDKAANVCELTPEEVAARILQYDCNRLVITGGEPLLQQEDCAETISIVRKQKPNTFVEVETNGTVIPSASMAELTDQFNVSPKTSKSIVPANLRIKPDALTYFANSPKSWFKFVITEELEINEILELRRAFSISTERILLMPQGKTHASLESNAAMVGDLCRTYGLRYSDRLHIRLWGNKRGK